MKNFTFFVTLSLLLIAGPAFGQPDLTGTWCIYTSEANSGGEFDVPPAGNFSEPDPYEIVIDEQDDSYTHGSLFYGHVVHDSNPPPPEYGFFSGVLDGRRISMTHWDSVTRGTLRQRINRPLRIHFINNAFDAKNRIAKTAIGVAIKRNCRNQSENRTITLTPPYPDDRGFFPDIRERGAFITALKTFTIDSIGIEADNNNTNPVNLTVNIYSASGFDRDYLLETSSKSFTIDSPGFYDIPIDFTFNTNQEYDIAIESNRTTKTRLFIFDPDLGDLPFNVENMVEVRDGEIDGDSTNTRLPHFRMNIVP